jgi:hypothetical protein
VGPGAPDRRFTAATPTVRCPNPITRAALPVAGSTTNVSTAVTAAKTTSPLHCATGRHRPSSPTVAARAQPPLTNTMTASGSSTTPHWSVLHLSSSPSLCLCRSIRKDHIFIDSHGQTPTGPNLADPNDATRPPPPAAPCGSLPDPPDHVPGVCRRYQQLPHQAHCRVDAGTKSVKEAAFPACHSLPRCSGSGSAGQVIVRAGCCLSLAACRASGR